MRMFITSKNKYLSNDMKIFGTCSIPLTYCLTFLEQKLEKTVLQETCQSLKQENHDLNKLAENLSLRYSVRYFSKIFRIFVYCTFPRLPYLTTFGIFPLGTFH